VFRMIARELTCRQPDDLGKGTTSVVPLRSHPRGHPEEAESPAKPETPNEGSLHKISSHPNQTKGCPIFAFCAKVGGDTTKATPSERKLCRPQIAKQPCHPDRSEAQWRDLVFHTIARGSTCHQPDDLGKGTTSVVPLRFTINDGL
jgi:hypothetical protein